MGADERTRQDRAMTLGLALGAVVGLIVGLVFFGNAALGVAMGPPLGLVLALAVQESRRSSREPQDR